MTVVHLTRSGSSADAWSLRSSLDQPPLLQPATEFEAGNSYTLVESRRDDDQLTGVNAHRVEVFQDAVVLLIADDFDLNAHLPAAQIFLDKDLFNAAIKRPLESGSISS